MSFVYSDKLDSVGIYTIDDAFVIVIPEKKLWEHYHHSWS